MPYTPDDFQSFGGDFPQEQKPQGEPQPEPTSEQGFGDAAAGWSSPQAGQEWNAAGFEAGSAQTAASFEPTPEGDPSKDNWALAATIVGVLSLCVSIIPICGFPTSLAAIGLGAFSLKAPTRRTLAIVGIVLGALAILISICSAAFGVLAMLGDTGGYY